MNDKEKQIEELASLMADCNTTCDECFKEVESVMTMKIKEREKYCQVYAYAQRAVAQGYRKLHEDSVVLSSEEWECLHNDYAKALYNARQQTRKETAREILKDLFEEAIRTGSTSMEVLVMEYAEENGVEVEDD